MYKKRTTPKSHDEITYSLWASVKLPFMLPLWCCNHHEWESFDTHQAGCVKCGKHHLCTRVTCNLTELENGDLVCPITAYCIPCIRACVNVPEFCPHYYEPHKTHKPSHFTEEQLHDLITTYVQKTIQSSRVVCSLRDEHNNMLKRRMFVFTRLCRQAKHDGYSSGVYNTPPIADIAAKLAYVSQNGRIPLLLNAEALSKICARCTSALVRLLFVVDSIWKTSTHAKIHNLIIGLVYMMRTGSTFQDTILLPHVPILSRILCHETSMTPVLDVRSKIITETENVFKMHIRNLPMEKIYLLGQLQYTVP